MKVFEKVLNVPGPMSHGMDAMRPPMLKRLCQILMSSPASAPFSGEACGLSKYELTDEVVHEIASNS